MIVLVIFFYLIIAVLSYFLFVNKWDNSFIEKIAFSLGWPLAIILFIIERINDK